MLKACVRGCAGPHAPRRNANASACGVLAAYDASLDKLRSSEPIIFASSLPGGFQHTPDFTSLTGPISGRRGIFSVRGLPGRRHDPWLDPLPIDDAGAARIGSAERRRSGIYLRGAEPKRDKRQTRIASGAWLMSMGQRCLLADQPPRHPPLDKVPTSTRALHPLLSTLWNSAPCISEMLHTAGLPLSLQIGCPRLIRANGICGSPGLSHQAPIVH